MVLLGDALRRTRLQMGCCLWWITRLGLLKSSLHYVNEMELVAGFDNRR